MANPKTDLIMEDQELKKFFAELKTSEENAPAFDEVLNRPRNAKLKVRKTRSYYAAAAVFVLLLASAAFMTYHSTAPSKEDILADTATEFTLPPLTEYSPSYSKTFESISEWEAPSDFLLQSQKINLK